MPYTAGLYWHWDRTRDKASHDPTYATRLPRPHLFAPGGIRYLTDKFAACVGAQRRLVITWECAGSATGVRNYNQKSSSTPESYALHGVPYVLDDSSRQSCGRWH
ncbi:hypothetical protein TNCV_2360681 [Trichonephila clavipes]|nr:hypothetical protein TNCV_2360681 [Trichonephila clavipes]